MTSPVVVDGRLTREKLDELLGLAAEHAELDFKATLDLNDAAHRLGLLKDLIAMANSGNGGYVVVGVNEDGTTATDHAPVDGSQFDSAHLGQQLSKYLVTAPIVTSQVHEMNERTIVLIHVAPVASGLPAIISRRGEYQGAKSMNVVLVEGVLYLREGTRTVTAADGHWPTMLKRYRANVVAETRETIDLLIAQVVDGLRDRTGEALLTPLAVEMEDATFAEAIVPYFDNPEGQNKLRRFLRSLLPMAGIGKAHGSQQAALDKLAIVAIQAVLAESRGSFLAIIDIVHELYMDAVGSFTGDYADAARAQYWLEVLLRLLLIGATAIRDRAWWAIEPLVNRSVTDYYLIWLRHAQVHASRAGLLSGGQREAAMVLVRARALGMETPELAPGFENAHEVLDEGEVPQDDLLLNALCQFDFLWCTVAVATHTESGDGPLFYPSCAALSQERTTPVIDLIARSKPVRGAVLPHADDETWKVALKRVFEMSEAQSRQYGSWWRSHGFSDFVDRFVTE